MRAFLTPRWLGLHALFVAAVVVLGRIGLWQWDKGDGDGRAWQHYGYAVQWWLFACFAVFLWVKLVLDERDPSRLEDPAAADPGLPAVVQRQAPPPVTCSCARPTGPSSRPSAPRRRQRRIAGSWCSPTCAASTASSRP